MVQHLGGKVVIGIGFRSCDPIPQKGVEHSQNNGNDLHIQPAESFGHLIQVADEKQPEDAVCASESQEQYHQKKGDGQARRHDLPGISGKRFLFPMVRNIR